MKTKEASKETKIIIKLYEEREKQYNEAYGKLYDKTKRLESFKYYGVGSLIVFIPLLIFVIWTGAVNNQTQTMLNNMRKAGLYYYIDYQADKVKWLVECEAIPTDNIKKICQDYRYNEYMSNTSDGYDVIEQYYRGY